MISNSNDKILTEREFAIGSASASRRYFDIVAMAPGPNSSA